jgi:hypothetical protein
MISTAPKPYAVERASCSGVLGSVPLAVRYGPIVTVAGEQVGHGCWFLFRTTKLRPNEEIELVRTLPGANLLLNAVVRRANR